LGATAGLARHIELLGLGGDPIHHNIESTFVVRDDQRLSTQIHIAHGRVHNRFVEPEAFVYGEESE
jgi:hypothetical protein